MLLDVVTLMKGCSVLVRCSLFVVVALRKSSKLGGAWDYKESICCILQVTLANLYLVDNIKAPFFIQLCWA